jgi:hypothetical protein
VLTASGNQSRMPAGTAWTRALGGTGSGIESLTRDSWRPRRWHAEIDTATVISRLCDRVPGRLAVSALISVPSRTE